MKQCVRCHRVRETKKFKLVKGKYRSGTCNTCSNGSKETMMERKQRKDDRTKELAVVYGFVEASPQQQIRRANLFLMLWQRGFPFEVCMEQVEQVYPRSG